VKTNVNFLIRQYLIIFGSAVLATGLLLGYFFWTSYRQTEAAVQADLQNTATIVETRLVATLQRADGDLRELVTSIPPDALQQSNRERFVAIITKALEARAKLFPELSSYRVYDKDGNDLYYTGLHGARHNIAERSYFIALKAQPATSIYFSESIIGKVTNAPVIALAKPLTDAQGNFRGVLLAAVDLKYYVNLFSELDLGTKGATALRRSEDGTLVARWPIKMEELNRPLRPEHPLHAVIGSGEKSGFMKIVAQTDGVERLYAFKRLADYPFMVLSGRSTEDYLAEWRRFLLIAGSLALAVLAAFGALLYLRMRDQQQEQAITRELLSKSASLQTAMIDLETSRDAAEAASRAKSTFLANMSHELRTPMNAIMGMTDLAMRHASEPRLRDQLGKVMAASQHLLHVINDILDISKIEAERLTLESVSFQIGLVMENLLSLIGNRASDKGLRLSIDLSPEVTHLVLIGDPLRLGQILLNFVGNAVKFTEHGEVKVQGRLIEETPDAVTLRFNVVDSGIGISVEDQVRLFTAFEQADGSTTRKYGGTGLGLAISKRLARLMDGDVGVDSAPGTGSTFWFTVRLAKAAQAGGAAGDAVAPAPTIDGTMVETRLRLDYAGARILLAEDEPVNQEVSRGLLEDVGFQVDIADDGMRAVAMARASRYAVILMDMQMPQMNGVDATRVIRADSLNTTTPILAMTANAFDEDRHVCLEAGMNDHIAKPVDPERLFSALLTWLARPDIPHPD
jgi:signal transduction histidine kinase/ActR/RegA family two-component response regulator